MKIRALLLVAIMIGGAYAMIQSFHDYDDTEFTVLLDSIKNPFTSLIITKSSPLDFKLETWQTDDEEKIENVIDFLQNYHVRKLKPEEIDTEDNINEFSIILTDVKGNEVIIKINENLIIQNSSLYYEFVDGPIDANWLVQFFLNL
ncbi:MAG: hypothetical protein ABS920_06195 [Sporosarcina sp.]